MFTEKQISILYYFPSKKSRSKLKLRIKVYTKNSRQTISYATSGQITTIIITSIITRLLRYHNNGIAWLANKQC